MLASIKSFLKTSLLVLCLSTIGLLEPKAIVNPTSDFYVNDYANLLSTEVKNYIIETNTKLENATGAQIVVVTIQSLEGESLEEYATELFRSFGIGDKDKNNGVLLLLALEERKFRIEVGYGLEGALPDGKTGRIQDEYIIPYLKENNWDDGIKNGYSKILEVVSEEYNIDVGAMEAEAAEEQTNTVEIILYLVIFVIILSFIIRNPHIGIFWGGNMFSGHRGSGGGGFSGGGGSSRGF